MQDGSTVNAQYYLHIMTSSHYVQIAMNLLVPCIATHSMNNSIRINLCLLLAGNDSWLVHLCIHLMERVFLLITKNRQLVSSLMHLSVHTMHGDSPLNINLKKSKLSARPTLVIHMNLHESEIHDGLCIVWIEWFVQICHLSFFNTHLKFMVIRTHCELDIMEWLVKWMHRV